MSQKRRKRSVMDEPIITSRVIQQCCDLVKNFKFWDYKVNVEDLKKRDLALCCALILTGCRISELLMIKREQVQVDKSEITIIGVKTLKGGLVRKQIIMPFVGSLSFFTFKFADWFMKIPEDGQAYLFPRSNVWGGFMWDKPMTRQRAQQIIMRGTGKFPHWFRGVHETYMARLVLLHDSWKLKEYMGLKTVEATVPYIRGELEEEDKARLKML